MYIKPTIFKTLKQQYCLAYHTSPGDLDQQEMLCLSGKLNTFPYMEDFLFLNKWLSGTNSYISLFYTSSNFLEHS